LSRGFIMQSSLLNLAKDFGAKAFSAKGEKG
jgi:hypothetical protein